ncbi:MFS transporter [Nocardia terpenica]|uniref:MFS transporter n=1 Tax=Nocardia terpenica TaxID=455432 RepID=A0A291RK29_9NOCA|nr:MFS transporter [Nocardia terpenica]ATL67640.1 MFS transporter [Nocardia terpenica]
MSTTLETASPTAVRTGSPSARVLIPALFGSFVIVLDASAVNVAVPVLGRELGASVSGLQWVLDGYTLMFAALMLSAGALADRIGAGRAFSIGLAGFTLASVACGAAPNLGTLIGARFVQGIAAALVLPSSLSLVRQGFADPARRAWALSMWAVAGSVAIAGGPVAGGVLTGMVSWRAIFLINVPFGIAALVFVARMAPSPRRAAPLDLLGQATAVLASAALTFALIEGGQAGFGSGPVLGALVLTVLSGAAFFAVESRVEQPMVPLGMFRARGVSITMAVGFAFNAAFYGIVFLLSLYLQQVRGLSAPATGAAFVPMMAIIGLANVSSPRVAARFGPRVPIVGGLLLVVLGSILLLAVHDSTPAALLAVLAVPVGAGGGLLVPTVMSVLLEAVPADRSGMASGVFNAIRQMGAAMAVAVYGSLVAGGAGFHHGMTVDLLIGAALVLSSAVGALALRTADR